MEEKEKKQKTKNRHLMLSGLKLLPQVMQKKEEKRKKKEGKRPDA